MNSVLIALIITGVVVLGWKFLDTRAKIAASPRYAKRKGVFYLLSAFTILVGITTVFADALFEFLGLQKPAHFELMTFMAFAIFCTAAVLILRDKDEQSPPAKNNEVDIGGDAGVVVNKSKGPVKIGTGIDKKKAPIAANSRLFAGNNQGAAVLGDAGNVIVGDNTTIIHAPQKAMPKWLTSYPRFDEKLIGRTQDLAQLARMLAESKNVVLVNGMGGIGKTTLAIAYLDKFKDQYDHIVWLEQLGDFPEAILTNELLLSNLGITSVAGEPKKDTQRILNQLGNIGGNCLLVIDNADNRLHPYRTHLPPDWRILITSRNELAFNATFDLDFLDEAGALALFYAHYEHAPDDALVLEIIKAVEFHTLTIELLAKTAARKKRTLSLNKLWQNIQARGLQLGKVINIRSVHSRNKNIEKIFPYLCSLFEAQNLSAPEMGLLKQLVCLPPTFHTFDELKDLLQIDTEETIEQLADSIRRLNKKGWLLADQAADAYKMHRIVLDVLRTQLKIEEDDVAKLLAQLIKVTNYDAGQNPVEQFPLLPYGKHLLAVIGHKSSQNTGRLHNNIAGLYQDQGRYEEALTYYQKALAIWETVLDDQHPDLAALYNNIGLLYKAQGRYEEALIYYQKALAIKEAVLNDQHPDLADSYHNIAGLYQAQGRYQEALTYCQKALAISEAVLDDQHPNLASSYNSIAILYQDQGRYQEALTYFQKTITILEIILDAQHPNLASSYNNIAVLYHVQGHYEKALNYFQKAIEIVEAVLDDQHPDLAQSYNNIAMLYQAQRRYQKALTYYQKAIVIQEAVLDDQHPDLAASYNNIGLLYQAQRDYEQAFTYHQKAIEIVEAMLDDQHPDLVTYYNGIGMLYQAQGRYEQAFIYFQKAIAISEAVLDEQHPDLATSYNNIGMLYQAQGRYERAFAYLQKAIAIMQTALGEQHPSTQIVKENLEVLKTKIKEG